MIARVALVLVALAAIAWLGVMERDTRLMANGKKLAGSVSAPGTFARAQSDFRRARLLNPDTTPDLALSLLYQAKGDRTRSVAAAESVLRREPDNLIAWSQLYSVSRGHDPAAVRRVIAAVRRLDPLDAPRG